MITTTDTMTTVTVYKDIRLEGIEIHWRGGSIFGIWTYGPYHNEDELTEVDAFTHYGTDHNNTTTPEEAHEIALEHFDDMVEELGEWLENEPQ